MSEIEMTATTTNKRTTTTPPLPYWPCFTALWQSNRNTNAFLVVRFCSVGVIHLFHSFIIHISFAICPNAYTTAQYNFQPRFVRKYVKHTRGSGDWMKEGRKGNRVTTRFAPEYQLCESKWKSNFQCPKLFACVQLWNLLIPKCYWRNGLILL